MTLETLANCFLNGLYLFTLLLAVDEVTTLFLTLGSTIIFNTFALSIGIMLVSLHFFGYLHIVKIVC